MSYRSPIDIIYGDIQTKVEGDIVKAIQGYNINVDKDELIKALNYDRNQYSKGYKDGIKDVLDKIRAELIQSIQNGTIEIESGNEELFRIIDKYKESEE